VGPVLAGRRATYSIWVFDHVAMVWAPGPTLQASFRTLVLAECPFELGRIAIRPQRRLDAVRALLGRGDVSFGDRRLDRSYWVETDDERLADEILHENAIRFLLARPKLELHLSGKLGLATSGETLLPAHRIEALLDTLVGLLDLVPPSVLAPARGGP
jgi:hypothetical protein